MEKIEKTEYSARITAYDDDGSVYLYLGNDDWTLGSPYQWHDKLDQIWFDSVQKVKEAIAVCEKSWGKPKFTLRPETIEILERVSSQTVSVVDD